MKNQIMYQTCMAIFEFNETDCKLLGTNTTSNHIKEIEITVQPYAARIFMTISLIQNFVPVLCGAFIGAWSDRFGRKPLLLTAFIGYALYYSISTGISYIAITDLVSPWYYLLAVLPHAILGGSVTYTVAVICYISDVSNEQSRPYRMVFYEAAIYIGLMIGSFTSGFIYEATNSTIVFGISAISIIFAVIIITFFIPESLNIHGRIAALSGENAEENSFRKLFDVNLLKEMWNTFFKQRPFNDRSIIWLTIAALLTAVFVIDGSITVFYLFIREQFHWSIKEYTTYETVSILVPTLGNLFGIWLLRKLFRISLIPLGILAFVSEAACYLMKAFAVNSWQLYVAVVMGALKSIGNPMCRTIIVNLVPANELGKIFSFCSVLQAVVPFIASPVYTMVYSITLTTFPGFFMLLSANLYIVVVAFLLVILNKTRSYSAHYVMVLS